MTFPFCSRKKSTHSKGFEEEIKKYSKNLEDKGLPIIYSLPHLALLAGVDIERTLNTCNSSRLQLYKRFKLKKKRGGYRVIHTPNDELKYLQRWILKNILEIIFFGIFFCGKICFENQKKSEFFIENQYKKNRKNRKNSRKNQKKSRKFFRFFRFF